MISDIELLPWPKRELWTVSEAACLLCGIEPLPRDQFDARAATDPQLAFMYREVKDATVAGSVRYIDPFVGGRVADRRIWPSECIAWAISKEIGIPQRLEELKEMLPIPLAFQFDSDSPMYPEELDVALLVWRAVSNNFDPARGAKEQLRAWLDTRYPKMSKDRKDRIAIVSNWQKGGGRPRGKAR